MKVVRTMSGYTPCARSMARLDHRVAARFTAASAYDDDSDKLESNLVVSPRRLQPCVNRHQRQGTGPLPATSGVRSL